jgi:hypothetical protein
MFDNITVSGDNKSEDGDLGFTLLVFGGGFVAVTGIGFVSNKYLKKKA